MSQMITRVAGTTPISESDINANQIMFIYAMVCKINYKTN